MFLKKYTQRSVSMFYNSSKTSASKAVLTRKAIRYLTVMWLTCCAIWVLLLYAKNPYEDIFIQETISYVGVALCLLIGLISCCAVYIIFVEKQKQHRDVAVFASCLVVVCCGGIVIFVRMFVVSPGLAYTGASIAVFAFIFTSILYVAMTPKTKKSLE